MEISQSSDLSRINFVIFFEPVLVALHRSSIQSIYIALVTRGSTLALHVLLLLPLWQSTHHFTTRWVILSITCRSTKNYEDRHLWDSNCVARPPSITLKPSTCCRNSSTIFNCADRAISHYIIATTSLNGGFFIK
jgi:hypothetical protein